MNRDPAEAPLVCIVEDDDTIRRALTRLVDSLGLRSRAFAAPTQLLDQAPWEEAACLLLDVQLPDMNGFELYDRIVADGATPPVIFVTGEPRAETWKNADRVQAVACLEKPFNEASVVDAIRRALAGVDPDRA